MSRIFPASGPRNHTDSERKVYEAFRARLPQGWTAWHSLRLREGARWEGEGDFVLAHAKHGLLVLEVKGGNVLLRDGVWLQNGLRMKTAPRDEAHGFARHLVDRIRTHDDEGPPWGVACVFPDVDFTRPPGSGDLEGIVWGPRELQHLDLALPALVERVVRRKPMPKSTRWMDRIHALWGETWVPTVSLDARVSDADAVRVALDAAQLDVLSMIEDNPRMVVEGAAGSGKTVVARELCARRARQGERVLYLCFTEALARVLDAGFASLRAHGAHVHALPIRAYARDLLEGSGVLTTTNAPGFWSSVSLAAAVDALPPAGDRPDIVVVDEAQDLEASDWDLVEALVEHRPLWIFGDPRQAFWQDRASLPGAFLGFPRVRLKRQQRCPAALERFAELYVERDDGGDAANHTPPDVVRRAEQGAASAAAHTHDGPAPDPRSVALVTASEEHRVRALARILTMLRSQGARPTDIAVVTLAGQTRSSLLSASAVGEHAVVRADSPEAPQSVVLDTFLRFKGLERPFIVVTELERGQFRYDVRMHIALTRACVTCIVLATDAERGSDTRLDLLRPPVASTEPGG